MTKLPVEQVRIGKGSVPSKGKAELAECANASCGYLATERHHIVRRSFLAGPYDLVEIDKEPRSNICGLCHLCHVRVTKGEARIVWVDEWCWLEEQGPPVPLSSSLGLEVLASPPESEAGTERKQYLGGDQAEYSAQSPVNVGVDVSDKRGVRPASDTESSEADAASLPGRGAPGSPKAPHLSSDDIPAPGEMCVCGRRVPHPRKESSPKDTAQLNLGKAPTDAVARIKSRLDDFCELAGVQELPFARLKAVDLLLVLGSGVERETLQKVAEELGWAS